MGVRCGTGRDDGARALVDDMRVAVLLATVFVESGLKETVKVRASHGR